jgi:hypothetical protein
MLGVPDQTGRTWAHSRFAEALVMEPHDVPNNIVRILPFVYIFRSILNG